MSTLMHSGGAEHDIDAPMDGPTLECLPHGLMQHHAFDPHMWKPQQAVRVTTTDGWTYAGKVAEVSRATGRVLIMIVGKIPAKP